MSVRNLKFYGTSETNTSICVIKDGEVIKDSLVNSEILFDFFTSVEFHGVADFSIFVRSGNITLEKITATYPATFNETIQGSVTFVQPVRTPLLSLTDTGFSPIPFGTIISEGETLKFKHLMLNGPSILHFKEMNDIKENDDYYLGNFFDMKDKLNNIFPEYRYTPKPNNWTTDIDEELLKQEILNSL